MVELEWLLTSGGFFFGFFSSTKSDIPEIRFAITPKEAEVRVSLRDKRFVVSFI